MWRVPPATADRFHCKTLLRPAPAASIASKCSNVGSQPSDRNWSIAVTGSAHGHGFPRERGDGKGRWPSAAFLRPILTDGSRLQFQAIPVRQRQFDCEATAPAFLALYFDASGVRRANGFYDGKSQSGAAQFARAGSVHAEKALKHVRQRFARDADAIVGNLQPCVPVARGHLDIDFAALGGVLDRVVEQI